VFNGRRLDLEWLIDELSVNAQVEENAADYRDRHVPSDSAAGEVPAMGDYLDWQVWLAVDGPTGS
jgi:hypothetical protein